MTTAALLTVARRDCAEGTSLKQAPGVEQVQANCVACHSLTTRAELQVHDRKGWEAEVTKMMKAFGAPVKEEDAGDRRLPRQGRQAVTPVMRHPAIGRATAARQYG
jgi:hypothetical protein